MNVDWGTALKVWWSATWRGFLYGLAGGLVLGFVAGMVAGMRGEPDMAADYGSIAGYIAAIPASMLALKQALAKHLTSLAALAAQQGVTAEAAASPKPESIDSQSRRPESAEDRYLRAFVGSKADYYLQRWTPSVESEEASTGFNPAAFLLTGLWLGYRKMYLGASIFFAVILVESVAEELLFVGVLGKESPAAMSRVVGLVAAIVCGSYGNRWYLSHARKEIADVRAQGFEEQAVLEALSKRGGTSLGPAIGLLLLFLGVTFAVSFVLGLVLYPAEGLTVPEPEWLVKTEQKGVSPWIFLLIVIPMIFLLLLEEKGLFQFCSEKKQGLSVALKKKGSSPGRIFVIILITTVIVVGVMGYLTFDGFRAVRDGRPPIRLLRE